MENIIKNQVEILEPRNTVIEITQRKGSRDELRRLWEESVNLKIIAMEITQPEQHRRKIGRASGTCGTIIRD